MSRVKASLDHKRIRRLVWLVLTVFVLLGYSVQSVAGSVYYSLVMQAYGTVSSPPVILEEGNVTGASTIYTNKTSAKVNVTAPIWLSGWDNRVKITIDKNDVDNALPNFPVLIYLSSSSGRNNDDVTFVFDEVGSNSKKIAVTTSNGTQCYVEVEKWNATSEEAWLWVKVPSVSNTSNTGLYLYYDNDHANNTAYVDDTNTGNSVNVWDSSFKMVQHMRDNTTSSIVDSTSNNNDGMKSGAGQPAVTTSGKIDGAQNFTGGDAAGGDYVDCGNAASLQITGYLTVEAWVTIAGSDGEYLGLGGKLDDTDLEGYALVRYTDNKFMFWVGDGAMASADSDTTYTDSDWHYVVGVVNNGNNYIYVDGTKQTDEDTTTLVDSGNYVHIGRQYDDYDQRYWEGIIDEVRISNTSRSAAWIKASYENGRDDLIDFRPEDYVDNNTSNVDGSSPEDKGTHSNFTAQQYGPDLINDTLTEENTGGGATGITPITAFQDTEQNTPSTTLVDANCETSALSNEVKYLVIYSGNHGGSGISDVTEMVLEFGTTVIARSIGEGRGQSNHYDTNTIEGYYIVTGDGTNTLKFRFRLVSGGTAYCGAMAIIAIPLADLSENTDYFQSVSNAEDVVVNAVVGSWTTLMTQTFSLPDAGDYLVLMSGEGGCDGGSNVDASMMRFRVNGATIGSEYHEEWENNNDQMNFAKAQLVTGLSAGDNSFTIECQSRGSAVADFHRPRIVVIRKATFDQIVNTYDTSGDTTTSTSFVDFAGLTTTYTPNQTEYVIVLANFGLGGDGLYVATAQLRDETAGENYRVDGGEYNNDGGFDSNRDQITVLLAHAKQLTSSTQWKVQYRTTASGTAAIGRNPDNTAGIRSDLILWSMTIAGGSANYELDLEVQWTGVDYDEANEYLCIYGGNMASENLKVDVRDGSQWTTIITKLNATSWNNVSVSSYLTSSTFTIRFLGTNETNDVTQSSWNIDATLLHVWTAQTTYDYVLKVVNQVEGSSWEVKLQVYDNSTIGRLSNTTISLRNTTTTSDQIIVSGGSITQSEGSFFDLPGGSGSTLYIKMSNLQAITTGTSYLYVHLKIQVPDTSTYILYVITFEIT